MDDALEVEVSTTACAPLSQQLMHWHLASLQADVRARGVAVGVARMHKHDLARLLADKILSAGRGSDDGRDARPAGPEHDQARQQRQPRPGHHLAFGLVGELRCVACYVHQHARACGLTDGRTVR